MNRLTRGFTLIELMVVVAILGILGSIAVIQFSKYRLKAFVGSTVSTARNLELAQAGFYAEYFQYAPITIAEAASGSVNKAIALKKGGTAQFIFSFSPQHDITTVTDAGETHAIVAAKHIGSDRIIAVDMDYGYKVYKLKSPDLHMVPADIPASTAGDDLSGWSQY